MMTPRSERDEQRACRRLARAGAAALLLSSLSSLSLLTACGGGSGNDDPVATTPALAPAPAAGSFTKSATWTATLPAAGQVVCYDFDAAAEVADCAGTAWDIKLASQGRGASLATNSGPNGSGRGAAFGGPFSHTWTELLTWTSATTDPTSGRPVPSNAYVADSARNAFTGTNSIGSAAFEYSVNNDNRMYPTYRVFLVTSDAANADATGAAVPVYAAQIVGYYGGPGGTTSGHVSLQWIKRTEPGNLRQITVDATSGWAYVDLETGAASTETGNWHLAFNRYNVKTNGGISGSGTVGGFVGSTPAGLYDASGSPITAAFTAATPESMAAQLTATQATPAAASNWIKDSASSLLAPAYQGTYPQPLDYGWYRYFPTAEAAQAAGLPAVAHLLQANPDRGSLVRSGEGNSYARMRLAEIRYAEPTNIASPQTWTIEFGVQPAQ